VHSSKSETAAPAGRVVMADPRTHVGRAMRHPVSPIAHGHPSRSGREGRRLKREGDLPALRLGDEQPDSFLPTPFNRRWTPTAPCWLTRSAREVTAASTSSTTLTSTALAGSQPISWRVHITLRRDTQETALDNCFCVFSWGEYHVGLRGGFRVTGRQRGGRVWGSRR